MFVRVFSDMHYCCLYIRIDIAVIPWPLAVNNERIAENIKKHKKKEVFYCRDFILFLLYTIYIEVICPIISDLLLTLGLGFLYIYFSTILITSEATRENRAILKVLLHLLVETLERYEQYNS